MERKEEKEGGQGRSGRRAVCSHFFLIFEPLQGVGDHRVRGGVGACKNHCMHFDRWHCLVQACRLAIDNSSFSFLPAGSHFQQFSLSSFRSIHSTHNTHTHTPTKYKTTHPYSPLFFFSTQHNSHPHHHICGRPRRSLTAAHQCNPHIFTSLFLP